MNDHQDVLIRFKPKEDFINRIKDDQQDVEEVFEEALDELTDLSLFYYQSKNYDSDDPNNKNMSNHYVYFDSEDDEITHM